LAAFFCANSQDSSDCTVLAFFFDRTVNVLSRDLASLPILTFKSITRKVGAGLIDIGTQLDFAGIAGSRVDPQVF
jgi:hypothetical protein